MLLAFTPQDMERLAGPIGILVGIATLLAQPQFRAMLFRGQRPPSRSRFPISSVCPACRSTAFKRVAPETPIAFVDDRICSDCKIRYTPPTPKWAALVFVLLGVFLLGMVIYSATTDIISKSFSVRTARIFEAVIGFMAITVIVFGIKVFREAADPQDSERGRG
jgi:hypothetical protein